MGAWGGLCVFDHARFLSVVAPALRAGKSDPLVRRALARRSQTRTLQPAYRGLSGVMAQCDPGLTACALGRDFIVCDGARVSSVKRTAGCLDLWGYEHVADLFERVVTREAVSRYVVLGLSFYAVRQLLPEDALSEPTARLLIGQLDDRCRYWAAGTGGYGEGIRGWLDPTETGRLAEALHGFEAPGSEGLTERIRGYCRDTGSDAEVHLTRVAQFRAVLALAQAEGRGVLWGRDLRLFHDAPGLFGEGEARPQPL